MNKLNNQGGEDNLRKIRCLWTAPIHKGEAAKNCNLIKRMLGLNKVLRTRRYKFKRSLQSPQELKEERLHPLLLKEVVSLLPLKFSINNRLKKLSSPSPLKRACKDSPCTRFPQLNKMKHLSRVSRLNKNQRDPKPARVSRSFNPLKMRDSLSELFQRTSLTPIFSNHLDFTLVITVKRPHQPCAIKRNPPRMTLPNPSWLRFTSPPLRCVKFPCIRMRLKNSCEVKFSMRTMSARSTLHFWRIRSRRWLILTNRWRRGNRK